MNMHKIITGGIDKNDSLNIYVLNLIYLVILPIVYRFLYDIGVP